MKKFSTIRSFFLIIPLIFLFSCSPKEDNQITHVDDYNRYLHTHISNSQLSHVDFWNAKLNPDSTQIISFGFVANEYNNYFQDSRDIEFLKNTEYTLKESVEIAQFNKSVHYRALARNYIAQHRFKEALEVAHTARKIDRDIEQSQSLLFDIHMELGNYDISKTYLDSLQGTSDFGYLIRMAKWNEYKGDLNTSIRFMEKAIVKADASNNATLMLWANTNLADFYGRVGNVKSSYSHYLKALALDPDNSYAKKGIAWIVFSHERNPTEALRILDSVTKHHNSPDYYLLKAEIAEYQKDDLQYVLNLDAYYREIQNPDYGDMYNAYNVLLYAEQIQRYDKAVAIAQKEVLNRPTLQSYGLLAYSYLKNGDKKKAFEIVKNHLEGKTSEPIIVYHMAEIYKANGNYKQVERLKSFLLKASFEMGPAYELKIANL